METEYFKLPFRKNFLSFEYVALNYLISEKNQYKYMMEGLDENWVDYCVGVNIIEDDFFTNNNQVKVFPNPFHNYLNFQTNEYLFNKYLLLKIYSDEGKLICTNQIKHKINSYHISGIPCGTYYYQIINDKKILQSGKIIKSQ